MQTDVTTITPHPVTVEPPRRNAWETRVVIMTILVLGAALSAVVLLVLHSKLPQTTVGTATTQPTTSNTPPPYLVGVVNAAEPSGLAPPGVVPRVRAMLGYRRVYATDFGGPGLPLGWYAFTGHPGGDPNGQFAASHVKVGNGMLALNAWKDPAYHGRWTTGGVCQCGRPALYGAFFVRSRITGPGPNESEILWPLSNQWPPEVDFNETGNVATSTSWTIHYGAADNTFQRTLRGIDLRQWHTFGVIWTPRSLTFTVDGKVWGSYSDPSNPGAIPDVLMTLDLQQRPACAVGPQCPAANVSMLVDWVAEYQRA